MSTDRIRRVGGDRLRRSGGPRTERYALRSGNRSTSRSQSPAAWRRSSGATRRRRRVLISPVASGSQMPRRSELTVKVNPDNGPSLRLALNVEAKVRFGEPQFIGPALVLSRRVSVIPSGFGFHPVSNATQPFRDPWRLVACECLPTEGPFPVPGLCATAHHVPAISLTWIIGVRELVAV